MWKINKKIEYGLLALKYMSLLGQGQVASAKDISEHYQIPFPLLSKVLQQLKRKGVIESTFGTSGGYCLTSQFQTITLGQVIGMIDKPLGLVDCARSGLGSAGPGPSKSCPIADRCDVKKPFQAISAKIDQLLGSIKLVELFSTNNYEPLLGSLNQSERSL